MLHPKRLPFFAAAVVVAVGCWFAATAVGGGQPESPTPATKTSLNPNDPPALYGNQYIAPAPDAPKYQSIDEVLVALAEVKVKQDALAKQEKDLKALLKQKLDEQREKLKKLGVAEEEAPTSPFSSPVASPR